MSTVHGFIRGGARGRLYEWMQRRSYRQADAVVAVSKPLATELAGSGVARDRVHLVPNGWGPTSELVGRAEARARLGIPHDAFHVGFVGRLSREKGPDVLLDAIAVLNDRSVAVSFIGSGREEAALRGRARALDLDERVHWHGLLPDAAALYPAFDAFVLSSRTEGTPIALFEAMHARVPLIVARVGGVPDVVSPAEALLVTSERPVEFAEAIRTIQRDKAAAETRSEAAVHRLRTAFGLESWLEQYESIYYQVRHPTRIIA